MSHNLPSSASAQPLQAASNAAVTDTLALNGVTARSRLYSKTNVKLQKCTYDM